MSHGLCSPHSSSMHSGQWWACLRACQVHAIEKNMKKASRRPLPGCERWVPIVSNPPSISPCYSRHGRSGRSCTHTGQGFRLACGCSLSWGRVVREDEGRETGWVVWWIFLRLLVGEWKVPSDWPTAHQHDDQSQGLSRLGSDPLSLLHTRLD
ncbi:hypothetical protein IE53DRAFT_206181 [Violaceomyces palustris]|uniref:Uncharacterized protein n=1 Tax=Violaceomyces palustris TaxID=1673888 RepID=A0ACD0P569_9BASI|nr:hypothetical protein IE53DRAFT_206181 [Violaceomyces palustris]